MYTDHLKEYLSADEHMLHAQFLHCVYSFHVARAREKAARNRLDNDEADIQGAIAEKMARVIERLQARK